MEVKRINNIDESTLDSIVQIHLDTLTESFVNYFGRTFLKLSYKNLCSSKNTVCLIATKNKDVLGFALAVKDYSRLTKDAVSKDFIRVCFIIGMRAILQPKVLIKLISSLPKMFFGADTKHAELQYIAVKPGLQGRGIGKLIIDDLGKEFKKEGVNNYLVGTKKENSNSNNFYIKNNFIFSHTGEYFSDTLNYYTSPN